MFRFLHLSFLIVVIFSGCSSTQKIAALKPEPDDAGPLIYENSISFANLPITIKLKDVENQINKSLNGLIYEDNNIEDDNYTVKIWKLAPITLENNQVGKITTILPLKANINYRYGINELGVSLYDTYEISLSGKVSLLSNIGLTNWKLNTQTELKSLVWNDSPSIIIAGQSVDITYLINPAIKFFKSEIEKSIDDKIEKSLDFKPNVLDALEKICSPSVMSAEYESWLRIVPVELYATEAILKNNIITLEMGLKCYIETLIGERPESKFDRDKIILKPVSKMPDKISANIVVVSTYQDATKLMLKNFQGKEFGDGKKKVTVQDIAIWHNNGKMVIALNLSGSVKGTIYLTGFPQYNDSTKEIYFEKLEYVLDTKNKLLRSANWLVSGYALKKFQEACRYSISSNLEDGKQEMLNYTKNYSPMPGVFINGDLGDIEFRKIQLTNKAIIAFLHIKGKINITIDGLK